MMVFQKLLTGIFSVCNRTPKHQPRKQQYGNVYAMLFGAVALTGVLASVGMQTLTGPVTTITRVTQANVSQNNLDLNKLMLTKREATDPDLDSTNEPVPFRPATTGQPHPAGGGVVPDGFGLTITDPWGTRYGYCAWDHGSDNTPPAGLIAGDSTVAAIATRTFVALVSAGPNRIFESRCTNSTEPSTVVGGVTTDNRFTLLKPANSDDISVVESYAGTGATAGDILWEKKLDSGVDKIMPKDTTPPVQITKLRAQAELAVDKITSLAATTMANNIEITSGLKLQEIAKAKCTTAADIGTIAVNASGAVMACDGVMPTPKWQSSGSKWMDSTTVGDIHRNTGKVGIGKVNPTSTLDVEGNTNIKGATTLDGTLTVKAAFPTTLNGSLTVAAGMATALNGSLDVATNMATTLGGSLSVERASTLKGALTVGVASPPAPVTTTMNGTLDVTGMTTLGASLTVDADTPPTGDGLFKVNPTDDTVTIVDGTPATGNAIDITGNASITTGNLTLTTGNVILSDGNLNISRAIASPTLPESLADGNLTVAGFVDVGTALDGACSAARAGALRYRETTAPVVKVMEFCDGTTWKSITSGSAMALDDLSDVGIASTPTLGSVLTYQEITVGGAKEWRPATSIGAGSLNLADALDFSEFEDTMQLDAATSVDLNTQSLTFNNLTTTHNILTISPTRLSTDRGFRVGDDAATCTSAVGDNGNRGIIRYNSSGLLQVCGATGWQNLSSAGSLPSTCAAGDTLVYETLPTAAWVCVDNPDPFAFTDTMIDVGTDTVESPELTITGLSKPTNASIVTIAGFTDPAAAINVFNGTAWSGYGPSWPISNNNRIKARVTKPATTGTQARANVRVGTLSDTWVVSTANGSNVPVPFSFPDVNDAVTNSRVSSIQARVAGISNGTPISIVGQGNPSFTLHGSGAPSNEFYNTDTGVTINNGWQVRLLTTASGSASTTHTVTIVVGGTPVSWNVTTSFPDGTPEDFQLVDILTTNPSKTSWNSGESTDRDPPTATPLRQVSGTGGAGSQINGIDYPVAVTLTSSPAAANAWYQISTNGGNTWTPATSAGPFPTSISNGNLIRINMTRPATVGPDPHTAKLTVGDLPEKTWNIRFVDACAGTSPTIGATCADGTVYVGLSPDGNNRMFAMRCDTGRRHNGTSCVTGTANGVPSGEPTTLGYATGGWNAVNIDMPLYSLAVNFGTDIFSIPKNTTDTRWRGRNNTVDLVSSIGGGTYAARVCANLVFNGIDDWYLPSVLELAELFRNQTGLNLAGTNYHHSSGAWNNASAIIYNRSTLRAQATPSISDPHSVRCVRREGS